MQTVSQLNPKSTPLASISITIPFPSECLSCRLVSTQQTLRLFHSRRKDISGCFYNTINCNETRDCVTKLLIALILSLGGQDRRSVRLNYISLYVVTQGRKAIASFYVSVSQIKVIIFKLIMYQVKYGGPQQHSG